MEIKIDEKMVQETLDQETANAVKRTMEGGTIRRAIETTFGESLIPNLIGQAVVDAASKIDLDVLTEHLAKEIARSMTAGAVCVIRDAMTEVIMQLRGVPEYDHPKRDAARASIKAELFGR